MEVPSTSWISFRVARKVLYLATKAFARGHTSSSVSRHAQAIEPYTFTRRKQVQEKIARIEKERPLSPLVDSFHRQHDYLRISLTERCNLKCFYCMPNEGIELSPREHILTNDEIIRLARLFVKSGVNKIRLTGGEPTIRKGILDIIARLHELRHEGLKSIAMTSNGIALHRRLPQYIENGLTHLNLSLDTLDPFKFEIMTRRTGHDAVLRTLDSALSSPKLKSVKLNVVVINGLNDSEIYNFVEMTKEKAISVRFIEYMPFTGNNWDKSKMVSSSDLLSRLSERYNVQQISDEHNDNDTARSWRIPNYRGTFGFISSMSDHFCASCNRLRITADGQIKVCLFDAKEVSLRDEIRRGASDIELLRTIGAAVYGKQEKHVHMDDIDVVTNRPMILIGDVHSHSRRTAARPPNIVNLTHAQSVIHRTGKFSRHFSSATSGPPPRLTHVDSAGRASMVDVGDKTLTRRTATASGRIWIPQLAYELVVSPSQDPASPESQSDVGVAQAKARAKGDVLSVAQIASIMGSKRTSDLIPLCHPLSLSHIAVTLKPEVLLDSPSDSLERYQNGLRHSIVCEATISCEGKTGVEMEALTAVSIGLLTVWDMLKAVAGKEMVIGDIIVTHKEGGNSLDFVRKQLPSASFQ